MNLTVIKKHQVAMFTDKTFPDDPNKFWGIHCYGINGEHREECFGLIDDATLMPESYDGEPSDMVSHWDTSKYYALLYHATMVTVTVKSTYEIEEG